jgi:hypothetical protein
MYSYIEQTVLKKATFYLHITFLTTKNAIGSLTNEPVPAPSSQEHERICGILGNIL